MTVALLLAVAAADAPICTDRPAKANVVCTVPAGRLQTESAAIAWSRTRSAGSQTTAYSLGPSVVKYGLDDRSDLQLGITPYVRIESEGGSISGFGDVIVRYKYRVTSGDSNVQIALIPFVKIPTAKTGIGNRRVEGGVAIPISFALAGQVTATLGPEIDVLADEDGHGRHAAIVNLVNLSTTVAPRLTLAGELWSNLNFDPAGSIKQASADAALAYALSTEAQLDAGANLGLTRDTPDVELYIGFSLRI